MPDANQLFNYGAASSRQLSINAKLK